MDTRYTLYHTLKGKGSSTTLTPKNINSELKKILTDITDELKTVIILLIAEHSIYADGYRFDPANLILPYEIYEDEKGVHIDVQKLPKNLKNILLRFLNNRKG